MWIGHHTPYTFLASMSTLEHGERGSAGVGALRGRPPNVFLPSVATNHGRGPPPTMTGLAQRLYDFLGRPDALFRLYQHLRTVKVWVDVSLFLAALTLLSTVVIATVTFVVALAKTVVRQLHVRGKR